MVETRGTAPGSGVAGQSTTSELGDRSREKVQEVAGQAREQAQELTGQAKGVVQQQVDSRSTQAGEQVASTAQDLRSVAEQLRNQGKEAPARLADQVADRADRVGGYLKDADGDRILSDIEDFARRQPWAVVAGGVALGFLASRFLKASSTQRYESRSLRGHTSIRSREELGSELGGAIASAPPAGPVYTSGTESDVATVEGRSVEGAEPPGAFPVDVPPSGPVVTGTPGSGERLDDDLIDPNRSPNPGV